MWALWHAGFADLALFAQAAPRRPSLDLIWATLGLLGAVGVGILVLVWVDRWWRRSMRERGGPADDLDQYRSLRDQGLVSTEEYERIRRRLEGRMPAPAKREQAVESGNTDGTPAPGPTSSDSTSPPGPDSKYKDPASH